MKKQISFKFNNTKSVFYYHLEFIGEFSGVSFFNFFKLKWIGMELPKVWL